MRMKKILGGFLFFCCLLWSISFPIQAVEMDGTVHQTSSSGAPADTDLYASAAVLMDADSGRVLYGKNENTCLAMASTTKIMTCIVILENTSREDILTVSSYAESMPKVKLYIKKGEQYRVGDLLYSLMLESHNDTAVALAEYVGKQYLSPELRSKDTAEYTVEESKQAMAAFVKLMNRKAAQLGCENTWFITPNGLDATETIVLEDGSAIQKEHCTTAAELARIMSYCIRESDCAEAFLEITGAGSYSFHANGRDYSCTNHNAFLSMMNGALSGKTGFTNKAGYCYVGALEQDGRTFVVALLACGWPNNKSYKWSDTRKLMQYGLEHYFYRSFSEKGVAFDESRLKSIPVLKGRTEILGASACVDVEIAERKSGPEQNVGTPQENEEGHADRTGEQWKDGLLLREDEEIRVEYSVKEQLTAPVECGMTVGTIDYMVGDTIYKREEIVTVNSVMPIDLKWCGRQVLQRFLLIP